MAQIQEVGEGTPSFEAQHEHLRRGDIIGIVGYPGRTSPKNKIEKGEEGELSIFAREVVLLTPCKSISPMSISQLDWFMSFETFFQEQSVSCLLLRLLMNQSHCSKDFQKWCTNYVMSQVCTNFQTSTMDSKTRRRDTDRDIWIS